MLVFAALAIIGCTGSPRRAYEGDALPRDQTAAVRAVGPGRIEIEARGYMLLEVSIENPVSGEPVESRFVSRLETTPWIAVPAGNQCLVVSSRPMRCPAALDELVGLAAGLGPACESVSGDAWAVQEVCFEARARGEYQIAVNFRRAERCIGGLEISEFTVLDTQTGTAIKRYPIDTPCSPTGDLFNRSQH